MAFPQKSIAFRPFPEAEVHADPSDSALKHGYFIRNRWINFAFRAMDCALRLFVRHPQAQKFQIEPKKILIANGAHLGDVLLSSYIFPRLKLTFPSAKLGILIGSWSSVVIQDNPLIDFVHTVDHWRLNRSSIGFLRKCWQYYQTRASALRQVRAIEYDVAMDLYPFFPNSILFLFSSRIPRRIGFNSSGWGPLLTDPIHWTPNGGSIVNYFHLVVDVLTSSTATNDVRHTGAPALEFVRSTIHLPESPNIVLHIGTGGLAKEWPTAKWHVLAKALVRGGYRLVFTGAGAGEREKISSIIAGLENVTNLCDKLSWPEFVSVIRNCDLLVGVDSVAGHIAAAVDTPSIILVNGIHDPELWKPLSEGNIVLRHPVGCFPCFRSEGCVSMACIRAIGVDEVLIAIRNSHPGVAQNS